MIGNWGSSIKRTGASDVFAGFRRLMTWLRCSDAPGEHDCARPSIVGQRLTGAKPPYATRSINGTAAQRPDAAGTGDRVANVLRNFDPQQRRPCPSQPRSHAQRATGGCEDPSGLDLAEMMPCVTRPDTAAVRADGGQPGTAIRACCSVAWRERDPSLW